MCIIQCISMKRIIILFAILLASAAFGGCMPQVATSSPSVSMTDELTGAVTSTVPSITVSGSSKLSLPPDMATIQFGVDARGKASAAEAIRAAAEAMTSVRDALAGLGIAQEDMQTRDFSLYERYNYDGDGNITGEPTYDVSNSLQVIFYDLDNAGSIIDAAVEAGATNTSSLNFRLRDPRGYEAEALTLALENAKERAEALAQACGKRVGEVLLLNDGSEIYRTDNIVVNPPKTDGSSFSDSTLISVGTVDFTASVTARFTLE